MCAPPGLAQLWLQSLGSTGRGCQGLLRSVLTGTGRPHLHAQTNHEVLAGQPQGAQALAKQRIACCEVAR